MFCIGCGEKLPADARYCPDCGKRIVDTRSVEDSSTIKVLGEQLREIQTPRWSSFSAENQDNFEQVKLSTIDNSVERKFDRTTFVLILFLIITCVFLLGKITNSDEKVTATASPSMTLEESKPPEIDCSKVSKNPTFGETDACDLNEPTSSTYQPKSSNSTSSESSARSIEDIVRGGLRANCSNLPSDFSNLRFQYRGETFNNYGDPLDLYALGNTNLTYLNQGSTVRIGYADETTYSTLNMWQCVFPFNASK
jgi:hypothetical protein